MTADAGARGRRAVPEGLRQAGHEVRERHCVHALYSIVCSKLRRALRLDELRVQHTFTLDARADLCTRMLQ